jgi:hypothetical protein
MAKEVALQHNQACQNNLKNHAVSGELFFHPINSQLVYKRWTQYDKRKGAEF